MTLKVESGMRKVEYRDADSGHRAAQARGPVHRGDYQRSLGVHRDDSAIRNPQSAFTLVELLVTIAIIAILAALLLGVAANAGERGREARTKSMVARLHTLVLEQYDTYKSRRAPVNQDVVNAINNATQSPSTRRLRGPLLAEARLYALRELMLMEIPDRWSDVLLNPVPENPSNSVHHRAPLYLRSASNSFHEGPTPLIEAYRRQYYAMVNAGVPADDIRNNQAAECLYLFVMFATADGEARSLFNEKSIGDTDGDGAREFLDGWGNPISFIRWAPGFDSDLQANANKLGVPTDEAWLETAQTDHDPFDPFAMDPTAFRLVPVIYSSGPDERYSLFTARNTLTWPNSNTTFVGSYPKLLIHRQFDATDDGGSVLATAYLGTPMDESGTTIDLQAGTDNINNHNITGE